MNELKQEKGDGERNSKKRTGRQATIYCEAWVNVDDVKCVQAALEGNRILCVLKEEQATSVRLSFLLNANKILRFMAGRKICRGSQKPTYCSWLHPNGRNSPSLRHTSSCCGCTSHSHTGTRRHCSGWPSCQAVPRSSPATRQTHRHNPRLHRSARRPAHRPSCGTGRSDCCKWVWGTKSHLSRPNSRFPGHRRRRWIYTGRWHIETHQPCILSTLVRQKTGDKRS